MKRIALLCGWLAAAAGALAAPFAYIPSEQDLQQLNVIDLATNTIVARISVGRGSIGEAVSPSGDRLYLVDTLESVTRVINTATNTVTATIPVCSGAFIPGLTLAGLYAVYVIGTSIVASNISPPSGSRKQGRPRSAGKREARRS